MSKKHEFDSPLLNFVWNREISDGLVFSGPRNNFNVTVVHGHVGADSYNLGDLRWERAEEKTVRETRENKYASKLINLDTNFGKAFKPEHDGTWDDAIDKSIIYCPDKTVTSQERKMKEYFKQYFQILQNEYIDNIKEKEQIEKNMQLIVNLRKDLEKKLEEAESILLESGQFAYQSSKDSEIAKQTLAFCLKRLDDNKCLLKKSVRERKWCCFFNKSVDDQFGMDLRKNLQTLVEADNPDATINASHIDIKVKARSTK